MTDNEVAPIIARATLTIPGIDELMSVDLRSSLTDPAELTSLVDDFAAQCATDLPPGATVIVQRCAPTDNTTRGSEAMTDRLTPAEASYADAYRAHERARNALELATKAFDHERGISYAKAAAPVHHNTRRAANRRREHIGETIRAEMRAERRAHLDALLDHLIPEEPR